MDHFMIATEKEQALHFSLFTLKKSRKLQWVAAVRRKEKKGVFEITDATKVCSLHFHAEHVKVAINSNRKNVGEGAVPSVFPWTDEEKKGTRTPPTRRLLSVFTPNRSADENSLVEQMDIDISMDSIVDENDPPTVSNTTKTCQRCQSIQKELTELEKENLSLKA